MQQILDQKTGDYYMDVREFKDGSIECVVKTIRPMHEAAILDAADPDSYRNFCKAQGIPYNPFRAAHYSDPDKRVDEKANHNRAVRRAKQNIRWLVRNYGANILLTLTYRENMTDREQCKADFKRFVRLVKKGWGGQGGLPDWRYVAVLEQQERGAFHVHCAVKGWQKISFLRACWLKSIGGAGDERGEETPGNIDVTTPKKARWGSSFREWKTSRLSGYLIKYLSKTFDEETKEKKRYWHSKDLDVPKKQRFILSATCLLDAIKEVQSLVFLAFGHTLDFSRSWLTSSQDCLWLSLGEGGV